MLEATAGARRIVARLLFHAHKIPPAERDRVRKDPNHLYRLFARGFSPASRCLDGAVAERSFQIVSMPVTARLLQMLHQTLGDQATDDLFSWWEEAASVNRAAVREVADLYFARFDARLEKGLAEVRAEMKQGLAEVRADLMKWMFIFWAGTVIPLAGLALALTKL